MAIRTFAIVGLHVVISVVLATVAAVLVHCVLYDTLSATRAQTLQSYIRMRAEREQAVFDRAEAFILAAETAFERRLALLDAAEADVPFDAFFPVHGDGTRRSAPALFDGLALPGGDHVYGVGAFLGDGEAMSPEEEQRYLAGFHVVRTVGEAHLTTFSSLYYFTPDRRMVMFAPERPDRLEFYRFEAPADFPLEADEDPRLFSEQTNPDGAMQCTQLSRFVYRDQGERSATACRKPVRRDGELLGAFGTSILMTDHLARALEGPPAGGVNLMFGRDREVMARGRPDSSAGPVEVDPIAVMAYLADDPRPRGVVRAQSLDQMIAFSRIEGPDWYFVSVVPMQDMARTASGKARIIFAVVLAVSLALAGLRGLLGRVLPLRRLIRRRRSAARPRHTD